MAIGWVAEGMLSRFSQAEMLHALEGMAEGAQGQQPTQRTGGGVRGHVHSKRRMSLLNGYSHLPGCIQFSCPILLPLLLTIQCPSPLDRMRIFQQLRQLRPLCLQLRVATDMLMVDEDVRHATLVRDFLKGVLNSRAIL